MCDCRPAGRRRGVEAHAGQPPRPDLGGPLLPHLPTSTSTARPTPPRYEEGVRNRRKWN